jgi:hypothetical protein
MRVFLALFVSALALPAYAGAIFTAHNNPQPDEQDVVFTNDQTATFITGVTKNTDDTIDFWSTSDLLVAKAKGQADVTAADGLINDVSIGLEDGAGFLDLIFNPSPGNKTPSGTTTVTVHLKGGGVDTYQYPGNLKNGRNFLTITTSGGDLISSVTIDSAKGFKTLKQVRISGITASDPKPASVPEPASMALIGGGLLVLAPLARRTGRA